MTYEATVEFKFDSTETQNSFNNDDFIPEQHFTLTAPADDLSTKQMFKLFGRFMLATGYTSKSIMSGAMSLVFNDWTNEDEQRKVCKEYELTMDEDLEKKYQEYKERDAEWTKMNIHYKKTFGSEPKIKGDHTKDKFGYISDAFDSADGVA